MKEDRKPLYLKAREYMLEKISRMEPGKNQLEPEHTLSHKLQMSRETIRKAMTTLIQDGIVSRWHGKGNFGHPEVTNLPMRIDINSDFKRILKNAGYKVSAKQTIAETKEPSENMLKRIPEAEGRETISYDLLFYADEQLAIQCQAELLKEYVSQTPEAGKVVDNVSDFLRKHCTRETSYTVAWLTAGQNERIADKFGLEQSTPLLEWEEVYYDIFDFKLGYIKIYFHPRIMDLSLLLHL